MREILFRGKAINRDKGAHRTSYKNGDWVYGLLTQLYDDRFENLPAEMKNEDGVGGIEIDYRTIGQYIGLTDKNGKKIFEGDIIKTQPFRDKPHSLHAKTKQHIGIINYYAGRRGAEWYVDIDDYGRYTCCAFSEIFECEIIGNIHDNPELLSEVK